MRALINLDSFLRQSSAFKCKAARATAGDIVARDGNSNDRDVVLGCAAGHTNHPARRWVDVVKLYEKMMVGPSESVIRNRLQTSLSGCCKERWS